MKALLCKVLDGPQSLVIENIDEPTPKPGEVVVRVKAAALNFFDTLVTRGKYQFKPDLPFSPSGEIAGVVEGLGKGVTGFAPGDRVTAYLGWGGAREKVAVPAAKLVHVPEGVSDAVAAGLSITYGTAIHGLRDRANVRPGETVAVLGASGGAGLAAVELAHIMGAKVIAVASSAEKLEICRAAGADLSVDYSSGDLKQALRDVTGGEGVDIVYDCVGGEHAEPAVRALKWGGRFLVVGFASGDIPRLPLNLLLLKGASAVGVFWGDAVRRDPDGHRANMVQLMDWIASGKLNPRIDKVFPLEGAIDALAMLQNRTASGKLVLEL